MRPLAVLSFLFGLLAVEAARAAEAPDLTELPLRSEGDLQFFVDLSAYRGGELADVEIYLSVTNDQLLFHPAEDGSTWVGSLRMAVRVRDEEGEDLYAHESHLAPRAASEEDATDRGILQLLEESAPLPPGRHFLEVTLTDENARKPGLFHRLRGTRKRGIARGWVNVRDCPPEGLAVSDLTLVRAARRAEPDASFGRNGVDFEANPSRLYGLPLPHVRSYLEVYGGSAFQEGDTFLVGTEIRDASGQALRTRTVRAHPGSPAFVWTGDMDLTGLPAGTYRFAHTVLNERTRERVEVERPFEVIWAVLSWAEDPERLFQEMALVMNDSELKVLKSLSAGAREIYLAEFWRDLDPDPDTPENEALLEFRRRIRVADREFQSTLQRGILTDRGRVYVRYGPPDEVNYEFSSGGFGPQDGRERVAGPGERSSLAVRPSASFLRPEEFREGDVRDVARQRGGTNIKAKQLEIWEYNGKGWILSRRQDLDALSHRGLTLIFADEMGNGAYRLVGSGGATLY
jgi:GWxTD domain-containing protein